MKWVITCRKAIASAVNVAVIFTATSPIYYFLGIEVWRLCCIALFFGYNILLSRRCLGQRIAKTYQDKPTSVAYAALYTASTATLLFWIWLPLDLALANGLMLQLPCLMIFGNTPHGLLAKRKTMTEQEHFFECIALKGECPDCKRHALVPVNETQIWCKYCRAEFLVSGFHIKRAWRAALTAAAELGRMSAWDDRYSGSAKEIEAHTIERCAQVADATITEDNSWADGRARNIAAAIRALKDKP